MTEPGRELMRRVIVSVNAVAAIRESRKEKSPDPVAAAAIAEMAGADGIAIHLRMDKRDVRDRDLYILRETVKTKLDLHIAPNAEMVARALEVKPAEVTLLSERQGELTTECGLDLHKQSDEIRDIRQQLGAAGCRVFVVAEPEPESVKRAMKVEADGIEIFAHHYADTRSPDDEASELDRIAKVADAAQKSGLAVRVAGGLDYTNVVPILTKTAIEEFVVGHHIVARAVMTGFEKAVREMVEIVKYY
jgi:pyridoxine 5-phosphate synthase